jgi:hypothetical protein
MSPLAFYGVLLGLPLVIIAMAMALAAMGGSDAVPSRSGARSSGTR